MNSKFDIGLFGVWSQCNYGTIITYYALNKALSDMGASVLMIDRSVGGIESTMTHARRFAYNHNYNMGAQLSGEAYWKFNSSCDMFMTGSDQLWNYGISRRYGLMYYLDFASDIKKKISYATSFGHQIDFAPKEQQKLLEGYFRRFNSISVREDDGVNILRGNYHIKAEQVVDPVFLCETDVYEKIAAESNIETGESYIFSCMIDPNEEKGRTVQNVQQMLGGMRTVNVLDGTFWQFDEKEKRLGLDCVKNVETADWVKYIINANYIVTDSYHTACLAIIFKKPFVIIPNKSRGYSRFDSIGRLLGINNHFAYFPEDLLRNPEILGEPDYNRIFAKLDSEKIRCKKWLSDAIGK